jgi:predicted amidophosphoribosyltransferase
MMTQLMQKVLNEIASLSDDEQDALAAIILAELESERHWTRLFSESQDVLERLADEALTEHRQRKTIPLNDETL